MSEVAIREEQLATYSFMTPKETVHALDQYII